jgi:hypothetical protein
MPAPRSTSRLILFLLALVAVLVLLQKVLKPYVRNLRHRQPVEQVEPPRVEQEGGSSREPAAREDRGLDRNPVNLIYTKHARCRMGCRHIDDAEVRAVLRTGEINWQKSNLRGDPDPKYAVEGNTNDGQRVRIIFASAARGLVVVTVIDLGTEWKCDCK